MAIAAWVVSIVVVAAVIARWAASRADAETAARVARCGLTEFARALAEDVLVKRRPVGDLSLTRLMCDVVEQLDAASPGTGEAAVVEPPDEDYRRACEELVSLGRLRRSAAGYLKAP